MTQTQTWDDQPLESSRTYAWTDPRALLPLLATNAGIDYVSGIGDATIPPPPIASTLGFGPMRVVDGAVVLELEPQSFHDNPIGSMHGGVIATLLDTVAGCAVHATLPAGVGYTSLDLSVRFIRAVRAGTGTVTATGRLVHRGSRTAVAEASLVDASGRLVATATSTCLLMEAP
ncbi:MAG: PaaI family thioesterase [Ornithinibacter sp.]